MLRRELKPREKDRLIANAIPNARHGYRLAVERGFATPCVSIDVERKGGRTIIEGSAFDFEQTAYRGGPVKLILVSHEIEAIESCPPGHFPLIAWLTSREDSTVMHVPIEGPVAEPEAPPPSTDDSTRTIDPPRPDRHGSGFPHPTGRPPMQPDFVVKFQADFDAVGTFAFNAIDEPDGVETPAELLRRPRIVVGRQAADTDCPPGLVVAAFADNRRLNLWLEFADAVRLGAILTSFCVAEQLREDRRLAAKMKAMAAAEDDDDDDDADDDDDDDADDEDDD
jgi:hypothetical protein